MTRGAERIVNAFSTQFLRRIVGCRWNDFVSKRRVLETESRRVNDSVREHKLLQACL